MIDPATGSSSPRFWSANRIVALYALIGGLWILFSDQVVVFNTTDRSALALVSTFKGLTYVALTALMLRALINKYTGDLRESEERFHSMFEKHNAVMLLIEPESGRIADANRAAARFYGYPIATLRDMSITAINTLSPEQVADYRQQVIQGGSNYFVFPHRLASGEVRNVEVHASSIVMGHKPILFSIIHDITDRRRAEEALRQSQAFNQALIDHSPLGISVRSRTGRLLFANAAWRRIWAISDDDLYDDLTRERDTLKFDARDDYLAPYQAQLRRVYEQGGHLRLPEMKTSRPQPGAAEWVAQHFYAISNEQGQVDRVVVLTEDVSDRKRAEEARRESEERFRAMVEQSPLSVQVLSPAGRTLQVNRAFENLWGITLENLKDYNLLADQQLVRLGLMPYIQQAFSGEAASIPPAEYDTRESLGIGEKKWVQARIYPVKDEAGQIRQVTLLHEDITERKQAEEALRKSEELYRSLVNIMPDGVVLTDLTGRVTYASPHQIAMHGATLDDLDGTTPFDWIAPEFQAKAAANVQALLRGEEPSADHEYLLRRKDGSTFWGEIDGAVLRDAAGQPQGMVTVHRDITERKQREREIEAIATVATALRAAPSRAEMIPVIVQHVQQLLSADAAALILCDETTGEAVIVHGQGLDAGSQGLHIPPGAGIVGHTIATGQPYLTQDADHDPLAYRRDLMSELRAIASAPLIAQDRTIGALWVGKRSRIDEPEIRVLVAIGDIAANALHRAEVQETLEQRVIDRTRELAEANERLKELDRLKSKFVTDVSHELRTPITSLMLNVELLEHGKPEKREQYLHVIRQQTLRQVQLIEDILNLSRLELSMTQVRFAPVNLNDLIAQAIDLYRSSAEAANLQLAFTPDVRLPVVMGVDSHLSQVVSNLIANAINYTPAGTVEVTTQLLEGQALIEVRDTGLGIAPEDVPHLFQRFYRGKLTWQVRGTGLGLAIVKEITEAHHGRVEVDSVAGVGSTFRVYLPIV